MKPEDFVGIGQTQLREKGAHPNDNRGWITAHSNGLTKREWYAGQALTGLLAHSPPTLDLAETAVELADRLIKELAK